MINIILNTLFIVTLATQFTTAQASDHDKANEAVIIVHKSNPLSTISKNELSDIFLGKMVLWQSGNRIAAGMLPTENIQIKAFLKRICNKSIKRFNAHWMKFIFSGSGVRPQEFSSIMNATHFVGSNKNAIAIVDGSKITGNVKLVKLVK